MDAGRIPLVAGGGREGVSWGSRGMFLFLMNISALSGCVLFGVFRPNSSLPAVSDRNELEAAQKFLEQAAIENLVSFCLKKVDL